MNWISLQPWPSSDWRQRHRFGPWAGSIRQSGSEGKIQRFVSRVPGTDRVHLDCGRPYKT